MHGAQAAKIRKLKKKKKITSVSKTIRQASKTTRKRGKVSATRRAVLPLCLKVNHAIHPILLIFIHEIGERKIRQRGLAQIPATRKLLQCRFTDYRLERPAKTEILRQNCTNFWGVNGKDRNFATLLHKFWGVNGKDRNFAT